MITFLAGFMFFFNAGFACYYALTTRDSTSHMKIVHGHMLAAAVFLAIWNWAGG